MGVLGTLVVAIALISLSIYVFADRIKRVLLNKLNPMRHMQPLYERELTSHQTPASIPELLLDVEKGEYLAAVTIAKIYTQYPTSQNNDITTHPVYWYDKAAELDEDFQQHYFGMLEAGMLPNGEIYSDADITLGALLTEKAEQGDVRQQCALGAFYAHRPHLDSQKEKALQWLNAAADAQFADALFLLGEMALKAMDTANSPDVSKASIFAASPKRHSMFDSIEVEPESPLDDSGTQARQYFSQAAQLGHTKGRLQYAHVLIDGIGGEKALDLADVEIAALMAEQSESNSLYLIEQLGHLHIKRGDVDKVCAWFEGLDKDDLAVCQIEFAHFLLTNKKDEAAYKQAYALANELALEWDVRAFVLLGEVYEKGLGQPQHKPTSSMYYQLAAHYYYPDAIKAERRLASVLSQADKQAAADLLVEYRTHHPITTDQQQTLDYIYASYLIERGDLTQEDTEECIGLFVKSLKAGNSAPLDDLIDVLYSHERDSESALWLNVRRLLCVNKMMLVPPCYQKSQQWREVFSRLDTSTIAEITTKSKGIVQEIEKKKTKECNDIIFEALNE